MNTFDPRFNIELIQQVSSSEPLTMGYLCVSIVCTRNEWQIMTGPDARPPLDGETSPRSRAGDQAGTGSHRQGPRRTHDRPTQPGRIRHRSSPRAHAGRRRRRSQCRHRVGTDRRDTRHRPGQCLSEIPSPSGSRVRLSISLTSDVGQRGGERLEPQTGLGWRPDVCCSSYTGPVRRLASRSVTIPGESESDESSRVAPVRGVDRSAAGAPSLPAAEHPQPLRGLADSHISPP